MKVALFPTCVVDALAPQTGVSTVRLLRRAGHQVEVPDDATCCGQPAWNAGQTRAAARVARTTLTALAASAADVIVVPAGSCATMIRIFWAELFELVGDHRAVTSAGEVATRVRELSEFLGAAGAPGARTAPAGKLLHHRSCHMLRELGITDTPERLLEAAGADRVRSSAEGRCCGFGGLFSVKLPETSVAMADEVLDAAVAAGATEISSCDGSCLLHLAGRAQRRDLPLRLRHIAEILDDATA